MLPEVGWWRPREVGALYDRVADAHAIHVVLQYAVAKRLVIRRERTPGRCDWEFRRA